MEKDMFGVSRLKVNLHMHTTLSDGSKTPEEAAEDMFMEKQKTSKEHREDDKKILEFQEILERLIHEEMQRKKEGEYRCRSLDEAIRKKQQARREAAAACDGKKNKRNRKGCR